MSTDPATTIEASFANNTRLSQLLGPDNAHAHHLESELGVNVAVRGNRVQVRGPVVAAHRAEAVLRALYARIDTGEDVGLPEVADELRLHTDPGVPAGATPPATPGIKTPKKNIRARSPGQRAYLNALAENTLVFALGPAGTGKTYLAVAQAVAMKAAGQVDRIILSRPAVEAGERIGFLPGDMRDKVDPYLRPLYDALYDMLPGDRVTRAMDAGDIEIAPLAFMRGRTLGNAFVILDEAQNTTPAQMKMFLTRLGEGARMVVTGDPTQVDLPRNTASGLPDALDVCTGLKDVAVHRLTAADVVRHDLVARIVAAYDARGTGDNNNANNRTAK